VTADSSFSSSWYILPTALNSDTTTSPSSWVAWCQNCKKGATDRRKDRYSKWVCRGRNAT
jgi:hypothetical protein